MQFDGSHRDVVVIGGGQAGLAMSHRLLARGIDHVVLERERVGHAWRAQRWDTFCLVTPNWQCDLPGFPYRGSDPDGFMLRDEIVGYLEAYAASFAPPLVEGVAVTRLRHVDATFEVTTGAGTLTADQVVLATGAYQVPNLPRAAERLPTAITQLHSVDYRNPDQLPPGAVLVVGTGQSGCQIAEDLHLAGRRVHLATGSAPRVARRYRGRDVVDWLAEMGTYAKPIETFADVDAVRFRANHYVTGRDGGRDIDLRAFARDGLVLHGRLTGIDAQGRMAFADDLAAHLDAADAVSESIKDGIDAHIAATGAEAPAEERYVPVWTPGAYVPELDLAAAGIVAVVWCTGFGRDHRFIELPIYDGRGYPTHRRGVSSVPGLYLIGLPWQHTWGSGRFCGVGTDAEYLAQQIAGHRAGGLEVSWLSGSTTSTFPTDGWRPTRTVA